MAEQRGLQDGDRGRIRTPSNRAPSQSSVRAREMNPDGPYSRKDYLRDAALLNILLEDGEYRYTTPWISPTTNLLVHAVIRAMYSTQKHISDAQALRELLQRRGRPFGENDIRTLAARFQNGPTAEEEEERPHLGEPRRPFSSLRNNRQEAPPAERTFRSPNALPEMRYDLDPRERETRRERRSNTVEGIGAFRQPDRKRTFKADILSLDTSKMGISAYINQLNFLTRQYGEEQILANIVPGLMSRPDSDGCQWFNSLDYRTQGRLTYDLELWKTLLEQRFRRDRGAIMIEADNLRHSFREEDQLSLQAYIDKKIRLYNEVGNIDEDATARRILMGVDPALAKLVSLGHGDCTIQHIKEQLTAREFAARRDWQISRSELQSELDAMRTQLKSLEAQQTRSENRHF
ncbi:hypothetical protein EDB81DRAFT_911483 [Dactylonectria macrodidyma]|uniref:Retrotransposon gag domain-containing protein n=1 Tax=Dactylonectria macrodidyma TaxID=307937 RepID=A0A9P9DT47_9HYPO|nr:hypothetical protein EDB81DRAFT_911483 [Dactylonectria macrodidyma]